MQKFRTRTAELVEAAFMLVAIFYGAHYAVGTVSLPSVAAVFLGSGLLVLAFLVAAELTLVRWLRGVPIPQYFATRDPVAAAVYYTLLIAYAVMPIFVARKWLPQAAIMSVHMRAIWKLQLLKD